MNLPSLRFGGTHRFLSLHRATELNRQILQAEQIGGLEGIQDVFSKMGKQSRLEHRDNGTALVITAEDDTYARLTVSTFIEKGRVGTQMIIEGDSPLLPLIEQQQQAQLHKLAKTQNHFVSERPEGEDVEYTFTPEVLTH